MTDTNAMREANDRELIALLRREAKHSGVWFADKLEEAAERLALLAARHAPAEDAVLTEAMALHKRWKAAVARHDGLLQTHAVTHPAVVRSGQRCAGLYSQLSVAAIEALAAMQPRGEQQAGREATDA